MNPGTDTPEGTPVAGYTPRSVHHPPRQIASDTKASVYDYVEMLARRKWLALGVFLAMVGLTIFSIVRTKPLFQARATFMVTPRNAGGVLTGASFYDPSAVNYVANCIELLRSRSMVEKVAEGLSDSLTGSRAQLALQASVVARQKGQTDMIELVATGPSQASAVAAANAYLDAYQQYDLDESRAEVSATRRFIEEQLALVGPRLDSSERGLEEFKASHRLTDLDAETQALIGQQAGVAAQLQQVDAEIRASEAQLAQVQREIDSTGEGTADKLQGISSPVVTSLQSSLNQLEVDKTNLVIGGFDETSQRVRDLNRQIDSTRAQLRAALRTLINQQRFVDPVGRLSGLFDQALTLNTGLTAARARRRFLAGALSRYDASLSRLPETERVLAGLTRDAETGRRINSMLRERYEEARIQEAGRVPSVRIVDRAQGAFQTQPDVKRSLSFGILLALALAFGSVWGAEYLDTSIRNPRELRHRGYPVLGSVPQLAAGGRWQRNGDVTSHLITHTDVESSGAEAFRMLRTGLAFANAERKLRTIAVTSPGPSEGKSTVAVNLASVLAQAGSRVLLVDADLRNPVLHVLFQHDRRPGLSDLIVNGGDPYHAVFPTTLEGLSCLPCGTIPPSPADLLTLNATRALFERLATEYDYVLIDTPPVLVAADTPIIGALVDTNIMVVRAGRTALDTLEAADAAMFNGGAHLSGLVVNDLKRSGRYGGHYYYHNKYRKHYAKFKADSPQEKTGPARS